MQIMESGVADGHMSDEFRLRRRMRNVSGWSETRISAYHW